MRAFVIAAVASLIVVGVALFFLFRGDRMPPVDERPDGRVKVADPTKPGTKPGSGKPDAKDLDLKKIPVTVQVQTSEKKPIEGAKVFVWREKGGPGRRERVGEYATDARGEVKLGELLVGSYDFIAVAKSYTQDHARKNLTSELDELVVVMTLGQGTAITGRVVDQAGDGIEGALLQGYKDIGKKGMTLQEMLIGLIDLEKIASERAVETRTDPEGYYTLAGLGQSDYSLRASAKGFQPEEKAHVEAGASGVDFVLSKGGTVTGVVVAADGSAIPGATVSAYRFRKTKDLIAIIMDRTRPAIGTVQTDASGAFSFDMLGRGTYNFIANADKFQETLVENIDIAGAGEEHVEIRMLRGLLLAGIVMDPDGHPVAKARVKAQATRVAPQEPYPVKFGDDSIETDDAGRFAFDTLRDGPHNLTVSHEAYAPAQLRDQRPGDKEIEIRLDPGAQFEGLVLDAETGDPVPEAKISVRDVSDVTREAFTDERGHYIVGGLSEGRAGERTVNVEALGYARVSNHPIKVEKGKLTQGVDFRLYRTGGVSGVVVNDAGAAVIGARVFVRRQKGEEGVPANLGSGVTNVEGRFRMLTIEPGQGCTLLAQHSMYLDSQSDAFEILPGVEYADLKLVMAAGGSVAGRVVDESGEPIEGATVKAQLISEGLDVNFVTGKTVRSDASGKFTIGGIEPGAYLVAAEAAGHLTRSVPGIQVVSGRTVMDVEIRLGEGSAVAGRVISPAGEPIRGATVTVTDTSEGSRREVRTTNARGEFRVDSLGQEPVEVEVKMEGYQSARRQGVPVNVENLEFMLERLGTMRGTAYDEAGNPVTAYSVRPERADGGAADAAEALRTITASSNDGVFEYKGLPAGTYRVFIRAPGYAGVTLEGIQVRAGETATVPDAVLSSGGVVDGQVVDAQGRPVEGAQVSIVGGPSAFQRTARPTDAGAAASVISRVRTGPDGTFQFTGLRDGSVKISVEHPDYVTAYDDGIDVTLRTAARGRRIVLDAGAEIAGVVVDGSGRPRANANVYLQTEGRSIDRQVTGADGEFRFGGLAPGAYVVRVHEFARGAGETPRGSAENVTLRGGQTAEVQLELKD